MALGGVSLCLTALKLLGSRLLAAAESAESGMVRLALLFESVSYLSLGSVDRVALRTTSWFADGTSQLAGGAFWQCQPGWCSGRGGRRVPNAHRTRRPRWRPRLWTHRRDDRPAMPRGGLCCGGWRHRGWLCWRAVSFSWNSPLLIIGRCARWLIRRVRSNAVADQSERLIAQRNRTKEASADGGRWRSRARLASRLRLPSSAAAAVSRTTAPKATRRVGHCAPRRVSSR